MKMKAEIYKPSNPKDDQYTIRLGEREGLLSSAEKGNDVDKAETFKNCR